MDGFWHHHGLLFILFMCFFPRLTLLFSGAAWGGLFWWLGLIFAPRFLVAILATTNYWQTDMLLCVITWIWALAGEGTEKVVVVHKRPRRRS